MLEADTAPGGRVRTDVADGFRFDRGFQVTCPAYPAMVREFDLALTTSAARSTEVSASSNDDRVHELRADPLHAATS